MVGKVWYGLKLKDGDGTDDLDRNGYDGFRHCGGAAGEAEGDEAVKGGSVLAAACRAKPRPFVRNRQGKKIQNFFRN
jgi:hypothetical protein